MERPLAVDLKVTIGGMPVVVSERTPPNVVEFVFQDRVEAFWCAAGGAAIRLETRRGRQPA